jgi:hypothetical protein
VQPGPAATTIGSNPAAGLGSGVQQTGGLSQFPPSRNATPAAQPFGQTGGYGVPAIAGQTSPSSFNSNPPQLPLSDPGLAPPAAPLLPIR